VSSKRLRRVGLLEDERAIRDLVTRHGFAVDSNNADLAASLYTDDCTIELNGDEVLSGPSAAGDLVQSETHQKLLPNCAHITGPILVEITGDHAVANGYIAVVLRSGTGFEIWRQGCGRWELERQDGCWRIQRRASVPVGSDAAQQLLTLCLAPTDF
jgi:uncharacterized protein (TIGR02246 family)